MKFTSALTGSQLSLSQLFFSSLGLLLAVPAIALPAFAGSHPTASPTSNAGSEIIVKRPSPTIVDIAASSEAFSTLTAALQAAGLVDVLNGDQPFTVFAPTNEAFAALPEDTLDSLLQPENREQLVEILTYHVVPGQVTSDQLEAGAVDTVAGQPVQVALDNQKVSVNSATVLRADIPASNGVIHVIDKVLLPPAQ